MMNILKIELDQDRIFGLDLLRAFAILFVVIGHGGALLPAKLKSVSEFLEMDGVSIFFVLSGFLIGGILIKMFEKYPADKKSLLNFWVRRWFRTLPNYFLVLIILGGLHFFFTRGFSVWDVKRYFVFSQNLFTGHPSYFFPEAWSLSVEEWFYLLIPVIIFFFTKMLKLKPRHSIISTAILVILFVTGFRFLRYENIKVSTIDQWDLLFRKQVFTRLDSLMYGVIGAYLSFYYLDKWLKYKNFFLLTGVFLFLSSKLIMPEFFFIGGLYYCVFSFTVISLATLFLLPFLSSLKKGKGIFYRAVTCISLVSYSMYLIHLSIVQGWIISNINWAALSENLYLISMIKYCLYWLLTIIFSVLLYKYFEMPCTKWRDRVKIIEGTGKSL